MKTSLKKMYFKILFFSTFFIFSSCDSLLTTLDAANQSMGGVCLEIECSSGYYNSNTEKYVMDAYLVKNDEGEDIDAAEERWVGVYSNQALDNGIGVYYYTSPYSNTSYRFVVTCAVWQN
jgi:hypothetical protein